MPRSAPEGAGASCAHQTYQVTFAALDAPRNDLRVFLGPTVVTVSFDQITNKNSLAYDVTWHSTISFRWVKDPPPQPPPA
jgi:hypothetical protein